MSNGRTDQTVLVTGGSGFFGEILKNHLLSLGYRVINVDLQKDQVSHPNLTSFKGDIRHLDWMDRTVFKPHKVNAIIHCAAILAHAVKDKRFLWESNVDGTRHVAELAKKYKIPKVVFISSNCLWAQSFGRPVLEEDIPNPVELYGQSKMEGENILNEYRDDFDSVILRCPTIIDSGRLGLLGILFEFIDEGRKVWVVGGGKNRYQFIYARDLADACLKALDYNRSQVFNIGSDDVKTFQEVYQYVIDHAATGARVASIPKKPAILGMRFAHKMRLSPLGPYQYKMIAEDFVFDTDKIKNSLQWSPTLKNEEMLLKSYLYYRENLQDIKNRKSVSAHKQVAKMGIIRCLKWIS